jgi:hypothetical protein
MVEFVDVRRVVRIECEHFVPKETYPHLAKPYSAFNTMHLVSVVTLQHDRFLWKPCSIVIRYIL